MIPQISTTKTPSWLLGGWRGLPLLIAFVVMTELISAKLAGDAGAFWWVTFHFVINPILCVLYTIMTIIQSIQLRSLAARMIYAVPIVIALGFIYISVTGNVHWVEALGISFK